jgi:hypothetical protein
VNSSHGKIYLTDPALRRMKMNCDERVINPLDCGTTARILVMNAEQWAFVPSKLQVRLIKH